MIFERMGLTVSAETRIPLEQYIEEIDVARDPDGFGFDSNPPGPHGLNNTLVAATCQHIVSETTANLPLGIYARLGQVRRQPVSDHVVYQKLEGAPNPEMDAQTFREALTGHCLAWGFGLCEIEHSGAGQISNLWPIPPWRAMPYRDHNGRRWWVVNINKNGSDAEAPRILDPAQVMVVGWWSPDGYRYYSPLRLAAADVGLAQVMDRFATSYFKDGHHMTAAVRHPKYLNPDAKKKLREHIETGHRGLERAHRIMILDDGMDVTPLRLPLDEAKLLESRLFSWRVIAALYRISADRVNIFERTSYASLAATDTRFAKDAIVPMARRWERTVDRSLLRRWEPSRTGPDLYCRHNIQGLLRGDPETSAKIAEIERKWGVINADQWRARNEDSPIGGMAGEAYLWPAGYGTPGSNPAPRDAKSPAAKAFEVALNASVGRVLARERHGVERIKGTEDPGSRLGQWYQSSADWVHSQLSEAYEVAASASGVEGLRALSRNAAHDLADLRRDLGSHPETPEDDLMQAFLNQQTHQLTELLETQA